MGEREEGNEKERTSLPGPVLRFYLSSSGTPMLMGFAYANPGAEIVLGIKNVLKKLRAAQSYKSIFERRTGLLI